jgi:alpha-ketoglutarate-dependent taurine dioxygenase
VEVPARGGQTLFASAYAAWDAVPLHLQPLLLRVRVRYTLHTKGFRSDVVARKIQCSD